MYMVLIIASARNAASQYKAHIKGKKIMPVRMYSFISRVRARTLVRVHKRESTIK